MSVGTEYEQHDIKRSIDSVITYLQHQMRDFQQRQAKSYCFNSLDDTTAFWLKDFAKGVAVELSRGSERILWEKRYEPSYRCVLSKTNC